MKYLIEKLIEYYESLNTPARSGSERIIIQLTIYALQQYGKFLK
jgi:hypothetical protein